MVRNNFKSKQKLCVCNINGRDVQKKWCKQCGLIVKSVI